MENDIAGNLQAIRTCIDHACATAGRDPASVSLVAVSKTFPAEAIQAAHHAGHRVFGESKVQEALPKLDTLPRDIEWHFIGRMQRNKLRKILASFAIVHGIDSMALASAADRIAGELGRPAKIYLQVNLADEATKGGFSPSELEAEIPALAAMANLDIQGLMAIPPPADSDAQARQWFAALRELRDRIEASHPLRMPGLSMGMSDDFEAAIAEGATCVRVGSAIFGKR